MEDGDIGFGGQAAAGTATETKEEVVEEAAEPEAEDEGEAEPEVVPVMDDDTFFALAVSRPRRLVT